VALSPTETERALPPPGLCQVDGCRRQVTAGKSNLAEVGVGDADHPVLSRTHRFDLQEERERPLHQASGDRVLAPLQRDKAQGVQRQCFDFTIARRPGHRQRFGQQWCRCLAIAVESGQPTGAGQCHGTRRRWGPIRPIQGAHQEAMSFAEVTSDKPVEDHGAGQAETDLGVTPLV
jgi:hypothetical protein